MSRASGDASRCSDNFCQNKPMHPILLPPTASQDRQLLGLEKNVNNGFRICGSNDRWFADQKNATAVFYGYDL